MTDYLTYIDDNTPGRRSDVTPLFANAEAFRSAVDDTNGLAFIDIGASLTAFPWGRGPTARLEKMFGLFGPSPAQRVVAFLIDWLILALAVWVAAKLIPGIHLEGLKSTLLVAGILGLLNALLKPTLKVLTIPLTFLTLGLFAVLVNAVLLLLTDWIADGIGGINFAIDGFWSALLGAVTISIVTFIVGRFVDSRRIARDLAPRG